MKTIQKNDARRKPYEAIPIGELVKDIVARIAKEKGFKL
jgi:hypothetical protein